MDADRDIYERKDPLEIRVRNTIDRYFPFEIDVGRVFAGLIILTVGFICAGMFLGYIIGIKQIEAVGTWVAAVTNFVVLMWISTGLYFQSYQTHIQSKQIADQKELNSRTIQSIQLQTALTLYIETNKSLARILREIISVYNVFPAEQFEKAVAQLNEGHCDAIADLFLSDKTTPTKLKSLVNSHPSLDGEFREFIDVYDTIQYNFSELAIPESIKHIMIDTSLFKQVYVIIKYTLSEDN